MSLATRQVHLDFHTGDIPFPIGVNFHKRKFQHILKESYVNGITLTARDHSGRVYYQSRKFPLHPQLGERDFLKEEIEAAQEINVQTQIYLTAGWDAYSAWRHPEWLERHLDGSTYGFENHGQLDPGWKTLCFNSNYANYLMAQTKDLLNHFNNDIDSIFYDILWQDPCYCNNCIALMIKKGLDPNKIADQKKFARQTEEYFKHRLVVNIHNIAPQCHVVFNEGNITPSIRSTLNDYDHLEIESLPGGDWGYQHFPVTVRYAKTLGKSYLGMTSRFHNSWGDFGSYRDYYALEYENFLALIHGAKCSIGDQMYPDGTLSLFAYKLIGKVYKKIAHYESLEQNVLSVANIGVVHPYVLKDGDAKVDSALAGATNILNEMHLQFDIVDTKNNWKQYKFLILPDKIRVNLQLKKKINDYLKFGGKILASFESGLSTSSNEFIEEFELVNDGRDDYMPTYFKYSNDLRELMNTEYVIHGQGLNVHAITKKYKTLATQWHPLYQRNYRHYYGHYQAPIGKQDVLHPIALYHDQIVYISHPLFKLYKQEGNKSYKQLIEKGINFLLPQRFITYKNFPITADCVLNHQPSQRRLVLGLLNYLPQRSAIRTDTIRTNIPVHNVSITFNWTVIKEKLHLMNIRPTAIKLAKLQRDVEIKQNKPGQINVQIPVIDGYEFVVINY